MKANGAISTEVRTMLTAMAAEAQDLKAAAGGSVTEAVAAWLGPQYLRAARENLESKSGGERLAGLRMFLHDWAVLRRGDLAAARLQLDREELEWQRANTASQKAKDFEEWIARPEIRKKFLPELAHGLRPETLVRIERELRLL